MTHLRILIDYRPALRQRTGVGEYAHELASALKPTLSTGDSLVLFSSSWKDRLSPNVVPDVPIVDARVPVTLLNLVWHRLEWPPIESLTGDVDIAHSMHPLLMPARTAAQVVTIYDLYFLDNAANTTAEIKRDYPALVGSHARRADAVITISKYTASQIERRLAVSPERITICPPGAPAWTPLQHYAADGHILFMGTVEPRKNVDTLLRAYSVLAERLPTAPPLVLAGKVTPACEHLLKELESPTLSGRVKAVGYVSGHEREQLYRDASMLVLPSLDEGFGMPALEAMTIGLPVIASDRGALPEVVGDAGILVDPADAAALASAMERYLTHSATATRARHAGQQRAQQFTWQASAASLARAYEGALERRRARR